MLKKAVLWQCVMDGWVWHCVYALKVTTRDHWASKFTPNFDSLSWNCFFLNKWSLLLLLLLLLSTCLFPISCSRIWEPGNHHPMSDWDWGDKQDTVSRDSADCRPGLQLGNTIRCHVPWVTSALPLATKKGKSNLKGNTTREQQFVYLKWKIPWNKSGHYPRILNWWAQSTFEPGEDHLYADRPGVISPGANTPVFIFNFLQVCFKVCSAFCHGNRQLFSTQFLLRNPIIEVKKEKKRKKGKWILKW